MNVGYYLSKNVLSDFQEQGQVQSIDRAKLKEIPLFTSYRCLHKKLLSYHKPLIFLSKKILQAYDLMTAYAHT